MLMTKLTVWALPHTKWRHYMEIITRNEKILYVGIDVHQGKRILKTFKINTKQSIVFKNLKKH